MKRILIVEDQVEVRELIEVTLRGGDYEFAHADNGLAALDVAQDFQPDLVLMDVMMPGSLDGFEAARRIKQDGGIGDCCVVMLTAKGQQMDKEAGRKAGADGYFTKPFSPLELIRTVERYLDPV